jgi:putative heme-binding domain-containing protein
MNLSRALVVPLIFVCLSTLRPIAWGEAAKPEDLVTLPGFKVELLRTADPATEGSWISIAKDPQGRLLLGAEKTEPITRVTIKDGQVANAEILKIPLSEVMGMLFAFDSLYINGRGIAPDGKDTFGLWRCRSTNNDGNYDKVEFLREWKNGGGDHGAHAILEHPDGKHLTILCGNFCETPADVSPDSPHRNYADDVVLPRAEDSNGFGAGHRGPGGSVYRMDPDGKNLMLVSSGERNTYDVAYNHDGELFGFDSDMENDWGLPWYRPIRVFHATSGADFGFREGSAKWPEYYHDSLPAAVTVGIGCPTGVTFGTGAKFPAKYQRAFFIEDWSYARLIAVHLVPDGSTYGGSWENFLSTKTLHENALKTPLNMTGIVIGEDGAMYFTIGGRHTTGALYRVSYNGPEPTAPADLHDTKGEDARALRHELESFHGRVDSKAIDLAWPQLSSTDRFLRYAARIAIESQPPRAWKFRALAEQNPEAALTILLSIARLHEPPLGSDDLGVTFTSGPPADPPIPQAELFQALSRFPLANLKSEEQQLEKLRVIEVSIARQGVPSPVVAVPLIGELNSIFPAKTIPLNRELCQILIALKAPRIIERTLQLAADAPTIEEQFSYIFALRTVTDGWTPDLRRRYFAWWTNKRTAAQHPDEMLRWFPEAGREYADGLSYNNFYINTRRTAIDNVPPGELPAYKSIIDLWAEPVTVRYRPLKQRAFVQDWKMADLEGDLEKVSHGRDYVQAKDAFYSSQCLLCHRFGKDGGSVGPDLTAVASRFSRHDILESILEPSKVISDQFANTEFKMKDGNVFIGRVVSETDDKVIIRPSMLASEMQEVKKADVSSREYSKISPMPPGLVNMLSRDEILDLLAFLEASGRKDGAPFKK